MLRERGERELERAYPRLREGVGEGNRVGDLGRADDRERPVRHDRLTWPAGQGELSLGLLSGGVHPEGAAG